MMTRVATPQEYEKLNHGSEDPLSQTYLDFVVRTDGKWEEGKMGGGKTGLIPVLAADSPSPPTFDLILVEGSSRVRFSYSELPEEAKRVHTYFFNNYYGQAARLNAEDADDDPPGDSAVAELKISFDGKPDASPAAVDQRQAAPSAVKPPKQSKTKKKKRDKSDMFDPFSGLLY